ncbi:hypothetical protein [Streptomyces durocortorensis]|uniref:Uncharacterized protein n=1 Tax=Streptomyces durocortorensis TaxID=2811104 RepID=A0ABS2HZ57_9ACTN|nr:hypothetical protein [Streptomyces durocortorensis]MBM7056286.1 hypothetical protein [Streptomyces durocortorensis]
MCDFETVGGPDSVGETRERGVDPSHLPWEIRHFETVQTCMRDAVLGILASAGFQVEKADVHSYGSSFQVKGFTR